MNRSTLLLTITILLNSCGTVERFNAEKSKTIQITSKNLSLLNGRYSNVAIDSSRRTLDFLVLLNYDKVPSHKPPLNSEIQIKINDGKSIKITLIDDGKITKTKELKMKLKDGVIELKRRWRVPIFWLVLNGLSTTKSIMKLSKNGNLLIDTKGGGCALFGIIPIMCSDITEIDKEFQKLYHEKNG